MEEKEKQLRQELSELDTKLSDPAIFADKNYPKLAKRKSILDDVVAKFDKKTVIENQLAEASKLSEDKDSSIAEMAKEEIEKLRAQLVDIKSKLTEVLTPKDPNNERDVIIEIRAAAGGDEASLFAGDLYRMYARWAETHDYKTRANQRKSNEVGGFKEIIFAVRGAEAYKNLKFEAGVHRVQRVPATESQGRIHTSTATVAVLPEAEETDIEIDPDRHRASTSTAPAATAAKRQHHRLAPCASPTCRPAWS